jgi:4'-phosphopantetheinyl transferase
MPVGGTLANGTSTGGCAMSEHFTSWKVPDGTPGLGADDVHIWCVSPVSAACLSDLKDSLSVDERMKADRFYFNRDREQFVRARGTLRFILGKYLNCDSRALIFAYGAHGKPTLADSAVRFNTSHSGDYILHAVSLRLELGVDVEHMRRNVEIEELSARYFSPAENAVIAALPAQQKRVAFFRCWTQKEAFLKAKGIGVSLPLNQFDVAVAPDQAAGLLNTHYDPSEAQRWSMLELHPAYNYAGAVAIEGQSWNPSYWNWLETSN